MIEWAAAPANSARARSPRNRRATLVADRIATNPNRASASVRRGSTRDVERREHVGHQAPASRATRGPISRRYASAIRTEPGGCRLDVAPDEDRRPVVERMAEGDRRLDPSEPVAGQVDARRRTATSGRTDGRRCTRRGGSRAASVLPSSFLRPARRGLEDGHGAARAGELIAAARPFGPLPTTTASTRARHRRPVDREVV